MNTVTGNGTPGTWRQGHTLGLVLLVIGILALNLLPPPAFRFWAWLGTKALLTAFIIVAGHGITGVWLGVLIDSRNKVSLSRLQMLTWTILILTGYLAAALANLDAGYAEPLAIAVPPELWVLMGISTTSLIGSPLILDAKKRRPVAEVEKGRILARLAKRAVDVSKVQVEGEVVVNHSAEDARWSDLFRGSETGDAGQLDVGKVQMFFFTLILVLAYALALAALFGDGTVTKIEALPGMDSGMLALLGISHAGYLVSKATAKTVQMTA